MAGFVHILAKIGFKQPSIFLECSLLIYVTLFCYTSYQYLYRTNMTGPKRTWQQVKIKY